MFKGKDTEGLAWDREAMRKKEEGLQGRVELGNCLGQLDPDSREGEEAGEDKVDMQNPQGTFPRAMLHAIALKK